MQISLLIRRDKLDNYSIFTGINLLATEQLLYSRLEYCLDWLELLLIRILQWAKKVLGDV